MAHRDLIVYRNLDREGEGDTIGFDSKEDRSIRKALAEFLENPTVNVPFAHKTAPEHFLEKVSDLLEAIPKRRAT